jgi:hypothetical protein
LRDHCGYPQSNIIHFSRSSSDSLASLVIAVGVWDPFAGSGTILEELLGTCWASPAPAPWRGFPFHQFPCIPRPASPASLPLPLDVKPPLHFIGSDIDPGAVANAKWNAQSLWPEGGACVHSASGLRLTSDAGFQSNLRFLAGDFDSVFPPNSSQHWHADESAVVPPSTATRRGPLRAAALRKLRPASGAPTRHLARVRDQRAPGIRSGRPRVGAELAAPMELHLPRRPNNSLQPRG